MSTNSVVNLYVSACRAAVLVSGTTDEEEEEEDEEDAVDENDPSVNNNGGGGDDCGPGQFRAQPWTEFYRMLSCLRQALTCPHCTEIARDPVEIYQPDGTTVTSSGRSCTATVGGGGQQHGSAMICRACAARSSGSSVRLVSDVQGSILIQCYQKLCQYLGCTRFYHRIRRSACGAISAAAEAHSLVELVSEGAAYRDNVGCSSSDVSSSLLSRLLASPPARRRWLTNGTAEMSVNSNRDFANNLQLGLYSVSMDDDYSTRITIKRKPKSSSNSNTSSSLSSSSSSSRDYLPLAYTVGSKSSDYQKKIGGKTVQSAAKRLTKRNYVSKATGCHGETQQQSGSVFKGCRCGKATLQPGKLTCCGQRCPCYVDRRACQDCKCRGCKNPRRSATSEPAPPSPLSTTSSTTSVSSLDSAAATTKQRSTAKRLQVTSS